MVCFLFKQSHFIPDHYRKSIFEIDYDSLRKNGTELLLFDLDNTIIPYDESEPNANIVALFEKIKQMGFSIVVISNNHEPRVKHFSDLVNCPYVHHARKPFSNGFRRALRRANVTKPQTVCVIGDQLMTDCWGAKRLGYQVVLVDALKRDTEKWFTRFNRRIEKAILHRIEKKQPEVFQKLGLAEKR